MIINFMKNDALDMLKADIPNNTALYSLKDRWIDQYFEEKGFGSYSFSSGIMVPDVDLTIGDSKTDYENAIKMYDSFKGKLNPVQASDLRMWAYLAHNTYWDYMRTRWAVDVASDDDDDESGNDKIVSRIGSRYFFEASKGKAFVRQGIARLYWSAYLTYDENNKEDPYEMTGYFLSKQDIFTVSTERSLARYKILLLASLKVLKENKDLKRKDVRSYFLNLNQAGGIAVFDALSPEGAYDLAKKTLEETIADSENEADDQFVKDQKENENERVEIDQNHDNQEDSSEQTIEMGSRIVVRKMDSNARIPIVVGKSKFQTRPSLVGLKRGDKFKISKDTWIVESVN